jgi:hypothetical protein
MFFQQVYKFQVFVKSQEYQTLHQTLELLLQGWFWHQYQQGYKNEVPEQEMYIQPK